MTLNLQYARIAAPRGPGRPKGTPNAINQDVREMILGALNSVGGEKYLARQAENNPGPFMALLSKILPTKVENTDGSPINMHLIAAQLISATIIEHQRDPQTIQHNEPQPANLLDAPPPTE